MLYISLVLSFVLLVLVNLLVKYSKYAVAGSIAVCFGFAVGPTVYMNVHYPAVSWQAGMMFVLLLFLSIPNQPIESRIGITPHNFAHLLRLLVPRDGRRIYLLLSFVVTLGAYCFLFRSMWQQHEELVQLQHELPYESLTTRLPDRPAIGNGMPKNTTRLDERENELNDVMKKSLSINRSFNLRRLHEDSVDIFVNSAGMGYRRMDAFLDSEAKKLKYFIGGTVHNKQEVRQPDYLNPVIPAVKGLSANIPQWNLSKMLRLHDDSVLDFVNPFGFGYVKDREHVAGFLKHGMSKMPKADSTWSVAHLELVGLVVHEKPVVYVTANLPQMEEVQHVPNRPIDTFEQDGLDALRNGEDLYYRGNETQARMMGSIRATKQCLACHGGSRGDLLGAFSYGLRRD